MPGPIDSKIDTSILNAMRAWRRETEQRADEKLALLKRLRRQFETGSLPKLTETQIEQSFNEQIFARVFDYATLLSQDGVLFHDVQIKQSVEGTNRTPDFAIGTFSVTSTTRTTKQGLCWCEGAGTCCTGAFLCILVQAIAVP